MVLGTPHEIYESEVASALLNSVKGEIVPVAAQNLLGRGVLSKLVRDPQKSQPGRLLKISEVYVSDILFSENVMPDERVD